MHIDGESVKSRQRFKIALFSKNKERVPATKWTTAPANQSMGGGKPDTPRGVLR